MFKESDQMAVVFRFNSDYVDYFSPVYVTDGSETSDKFVRNPQSGGGYVSCMDLQRAGYKVALGSKPE